LTITKAEPQGDDELDVEIETSADIPTDGSVGAFGYGIITDDFTFKNVLALTTHAGALDHTDQGGVATDPIFHAHVLDLAGAGSSWMSLS